MARPLASSHQLLVFDKTNLSTTRGQIMTSMTPEAQFSRVENSLGWIQYPFKSLTYRFISGIISTSLLIRILLTSSRIQKAIEKRELSEETCKNFFEKLKKLQKVLYKLDKNLEKDSYFGIIHFNIHNSLIRINDLLENLEIFLDKEIHDLGQRIANSFS